MNISLQQNIEYALSGLYTIATNTYENRQVIHSNNGILINDTISDFAKALYDTYQHRREYNSQTIRKSMENGNGKNNTTKPHSYYIFQIT